MKVIKDLPAVFDEFAEQRKNSFLAVKKIKENGSPVVGVFCTYFPQEIAMAAGATVVGLCSMSDETVGEAEKTLPRNLCPLIKSSYGFAKTDKCPFFYFSDLIVGETTCDGKKKMYEYLGEFKPVYVMELPNSQSESGKKLWKEEIIRFKEYLEEKFETTITEDAIKDAIVLRNEERQALKDLSYLMANEPAPMLGQDIFKVLYGAGYKFDKRESIDQIKAVTETIKKDYAEGKMLEHRPRILITGCPLGGATEKVIKAIEDNGGVVVGFENCSGMKSIDEMVDETNPDVYQALADRYLNIGCSCMTPNPNRYKLLGRMIDEFQADAVVDMVLQACHTYNVESFGIKRFVNEEKGIPYMSIETDYSQADVGQLNTRMAAFVEML
ncbi:MAG: 2-hydroxyacyl-CoA dehydratase family protein [Lachnospiraceae bacterium]|nr:2-hydroxyacyl-CoA dehydratase family protein [Lachnospiraceae bacterium]